MKLSWLVLIVLAGCGPVLVGKERAEGEDDDAGADPAQDALMARLRVRREGCGCFQLTAEASAGVPPYRFVWDDGTEGASRRVCGSDGSPVSVTASDAKEASVVQSAVLEADDAGCPAPIPLLCLENPSFEGTAAVNTGLPPAFDAPPWSACTETGAANTPDIVSPSLPQFVVKPIQPTDGLTYLALGEDEQASQQLCEPVPAGTTLSLQLDLTHVPVSADTEQIWLEISGGLAAGCTSREVLWGSPRLEVGWKSFCVSLRPANYMDQLTLSAVSDKSQLGLSYLLVDNMRPVERCP